jgi:hypothetical protein
MQWNCTDFELSQSAVEGPFDPTHQTDNALDF